MKLWREERLLNIKKKNLKPHEIAALEEAIKHLKSHLKSEVVQKDTRGGFTVVHEHLENMSLHWRWQIADFMKLWAITVKYDKQHDIHPETRHLQNASAF